MTMGTSMLFGAPANVAEFATPIGQDRLVRKEVSLGTIREIEPPQDHVGDQFAPFLEVAADDVIFDYIKGEGDGLAPARAEDAESDLAQKDEIAPGQGRASIIDWSLKDHYVASDVNRYRELRRVAEAMANGNLPLEITSALEDWASKYARDAVRRRRKLDNRREWLIMTALSEGVIAYNDGKIKFNVSYFRPNRQQAGHADNDLPDAGITNGVVDFSGVDHDPIGFVEGVQEFMFDTYGVVMDRVLCSKKFTRRIVNSTLFAQRAGLGGAVQPDGSITSPSLNYLLDGWGPDAALQVVQNATGVTFQRLDHVYRTRGIGQSSASIVNTRFWPEDMVLFLPSTASLGEIDDTLIGFGKTLTSPHPEGNWTPGFYEWEKERRDPWGLDAGTGCKMFPVFPHMEYTYGVDAIL